jgi:hypothetical protein
VLGLDPQRDGAELRQRVGVQLQERQLPDKLNVAEALEEVMPAVLRRTGDFARLAPACRPLQDATTGAWSRPLHRAVLAAVPIAAKCFLTVVA